MNKVILMGRLTADPEVRRTEGDNPMDFIRCIAFGKGGEFAEKYLHKGIKIAVSGRIQTGSYENAEGQKVYTTDVVVEEQEFAESKAASASGEAEEATPAPQEEALPWQ